MCLPKTSAPPDDALSKNCLASHASATTSSEPASQASICVQRCPRDASALSNPFAFRRLAMPPHGARPAPHTIYITAETLKTRSNDSSPGGARSTAGCKLREHSPICPGEEQNHPSSPPTASRTRTSSSPSPLPRTTPQHPLAFSPQQHPDAVASLRSRMCFFLLELQFQCHQSSALIACEKHCALVGVSCFVAWTKNVEPKQQAGRQSSL